MRPEANAFLSVCTMASWPISSPKTLGRYFRASAAWLSIWGSSPAMTRSAPIVELTTLGARGGRLDEQPAKRSLGLLPSGPDPVGEARACCQPPSGNIGHGAPVSKPPESVQL